MIFFAASKGASSVFSHQAMCLYFKKQFCKVPVSSGLQRSAIKIQNHCKWGSLQAKKIKNHNTNDIESTLLLKQPLQILISSSSKL